MIENISLHKDLGLIVTSNLKWTNHINYKINKARRAFFLLKSTIPWSTPSNVKYNLYLSTVLSIILYGSQVWHADMQMLKKLENFQKFCFLWIYGTRLSYSEKLDKYKKLPLAFHIQLNLICMFVDIISNKYIFNHSDYVQIKCPPRENMRRKVFNPIKVLRGSSTDGSFFARSANIFNYLHRHSIIDLNDSTIKSKCKNFLLSKPFDLHNMCTYFICCSCNKCRPTQSII